MYNVKNEYPDINIGVGNLYRVQYEQVPVWRDWQKKNLNMDISNISNQDDIWKYEDILKQNDIVMCVGNEQITEGYFMCLTHNGIIGFIYVENVISLI